MGCRCGTAKRKSPQLRWDFSLYDDYNTEDDIYCSSGPNSINYTPKSTKLVARGKLNDFKLGKKLGNGSFGTVMECIHKKTGKKYAVKIIKKSSSNSIFDDNGPFNFNESQISDNLLLHNSNDTNRTGELMFQNEVWVLQTIRHENIIRALAFFEDKQNCYLIIDYCEGGELFNRIADRTCSTETDAIIIIMQACRAIAYLHNLGIVHRDIKAENFLFKSKSRANSLILIDFGMAAHVPRGRFLHVFCGSIHYISPEVLEQEYSFPSDMWALGVLTYLILTGTYPYMDNNFDKLKKMILNEPFNQNNEQYKRLSNEAKNFICGLLEKNPLKRFTAKQALDHSWLSSYYSIPKNTLLRQKIRIFPKRPSELITKQKLISHFPSNENHYETDTHVSDYTDSAI